MVSRGSWLDGRVLLLCLLSTDDSLIAIQHRIQIADPKYKSRPTTSSNPKSEVRPSEIINTIRTETIISPKAKDPKEQRDKSAKTVPQVPCAFTHLRYPPQKKKDNLYNSLNHGNSNLSSCTFHGKRRRSTHLPSRQWPKGGERKVRSSLS